MKWQFQCYKFELTQPKKLRNYQLSFTLSNHYVLITCGLVSGITSSKKGSSTKMSKGSWKKGREEEKHASPLSHQDNHLTWTLDSEYFCPSLQLLSPAVGTRRYQSGTGFQSGQHCFIGYLGRAHTINGVFISPFSCQCRTSQSDSVIIIKKALFFFPSPHMLFNPNNIWELQPLACEREADSEGRDGGATLNHHEIPTGCVSQSTPDFGNVGHTVFYQGHVKWHICSGYHLMFQCMCILHNAKIRVYSNIISLRWKVFTSFLLAFWNSLYILFSILTLLYSIIEYQKLLLPSKWYLVSTD